MKKIYCYFVFVLLVIFFAAFHFIFGILFAFINSDAFHDAITKFENQLFKILKHEET